MAEQSFRKRNEDDLLAKLKEHIVQIEALLVFLIVALVVLQLIAMLDERNELNFPLWLVPPVILAAVKPLMRVNNPTGPVRNALVWGSSLGGWIGAIGGAAADFFSGGLTAGQGTLWGIAGGSAAGMALGNWIESWSQPKDELLERGEAFDYLYRHRRRCFKLANAGLIDTVLDNDIKWFDKNRDGRHWYAIDDLEAFILKC